MKIISVNGISTSGKTTICEAIITGLTKLGYSVGSVKEIHSEKFQIDPDPTVNTRRHKAAGSQLVTARGYFETDILYQSKLPIEEILRHYNYDFVILEGVSDLNVPKIISAHTVEEVEERFDERAILVSGKVADLGLSKICNLPVVHALNQPEKLVEFALNYAIEPLPNFAPDCCSACGHTCREMTGLVIHGEARREDCVLQNQDVHLTVNGQDVQMVPFVQNILRNSVLGIVNELNGFEHCGEIEVKFKL